MKSLKDMIKAKVVALALMTIRLITAAEAQEKDTSSIRYLTNGTVKVGIDLNKGGSITYLAVNGDGRNLINSYDLGRQIQMSFYSGPVPFHPQGTTLSKAWENLGWNPIQTGDYAGHMSKVIDFKKSKKMLYIKFIPMQWPLDNVPCECSMESWIKLDANRVIVQGRINDFRSDTTQYTALYQELPAIYTNAPFKYYYSYNGAKPFTDDTLSFARPTPGAERHLPATEHWGALVDKNNFGVGIYNDATIIFTGGFFGDLNADGGAKDFSTGYAAPDAEEILDHNISYEYQYQLIAGQLTDIRKAVYRLAKPHKGAIVYKFTHDRQHWFYQNASDSGWPVKNWLNIHIKDTCRLIGPAEAWQAVNHRRVRICMAYKSENTALKLAWQTHLSRNHQTDGDISFGVINDGNFHTYDFRIGDAAYTGMIMGISLRAGKPQSGTDSLRIKSIELY